MDKCQRANTIRPLPRISRQQGTNLKRPRSQVHRSVDGFFICRSRLCKEGIWTSSFAVPLPFEDDDGRGGVIVASAKGRVEVFVPTRDSYFELKPASRKVIVGESIAFGATITTGSESSDNLLLSNGTLTHLGENTKLVLTAPYQKSFKGTNQKAGDFKKEVSPSRTVLNLEAGNLVVEARKLSN